MSCRNAAHRVLVDKVLHGTATDAEEDAFDALCDLCPDCRREMLGGMTEAELERAASDPEAKVAFLAALAQQARNTASNRG